MVDVASVADWRAFEGEKSWAERSPARSMYEFLSQTKAAHGDKPAVSFQLFSADGAKAQTLTWGQYHGRVTQAANMFRSLGVGPGDVVAYILPNTMETAVTMMAGAVAGIVNPVNPLLDADQISSILRETKAKVVVTLRAFPKTDVAQKVAEALRFAPDVKTVLEVDLLGCLTPPKSWIVPLIRPKNPVTHNARVKDFNAECRKHASDKLRFEDVTEDRVAAYFHTGGTTGMPKVAQHRVSGMVYNGWLGATLMFTRDDVVICPLPMFHVFAIYPILMSMIQSGAHVVFPTPQGYRGEGVFDNFWKLIERWKITYIITVPTALSALMQRPVNADVSSLRGAFSGSAPLPLELYKRFEAATGVEIIEGYGLTECTCLVSCNPPKGAKKIGSVGAPFPYTHVRILHSDSNGAVIRECDTDEVGEICVANPGVFPCAYVELVKDAEVTGAALLDFARAHIHERAAVPKLIEILPELPKTAVGKVFKPDLRRLAITRVYNEALEKAGLAVRVTAVIDDKKRGLVAQLSRAKGVDDAAVTAVLGAFIRPWEWG